MRDSAENSCIFMRQSASIQRTKTDGSPTVTARLLHQGHSVEQCLQKCAITRCKKCVCFHLPCQQFLDSCLQCSPCTAPWRARSEGRWRDKMVRWRGRLISAKHNCVTTPAAVTLSIADLSFDNGSLGSNCPFSGQSAWPPQVTRLPPDSIDHARNMTCETTSA